MNEREAIDTVLVIPTFKERESLEIFLFGFVDICEKSTAIIISDDSGLEFEEFLLELTRKVLRENGITVLIDARQEKSGRGAAVIRGFSRALKEFPSCMTFVECDADSSHRPCDVLQILNSVQVGTVSIGSRYLRNSKIIGWPISRKIFSLILNKFIPRLLNIPLGDITNGLRGYDREAIKLLCRHTLRTTSFISLSESALVLYERGWKFQEFPITFVNRVLGDSTITIREVLTSTFGLWKVILLKHRSRRLV